MKTEQLIASLASEAAPKKPAAPPLKQLVWWVCGGAAYVAVLLIFFGLRPDLSARLHAPLFLAELAALAGIVLATGLAAIALSFPDRYQQSWIVRLPLVPLLAFIIILALASQGTPMPPPPQHGVECLLCISLFTLIPGALLLYRLRQQASVEYHLAGGLAMLAAFSLGALAFRLSEPTDAITHLIEWHYLPMLVFGLFGLWLGQRFLKW